MRRKVGKKERRRRREKCPAFDFSGNGK